MQESSDFEIPYLALKIQSARTRAEFVDLRAINLRDPEQQICSRFFLCDNVSITFQLAMCSAKQQCGRVAAIVEVAVAHAAAEVDQ